MLGHIFDILDDVIVVEFPASKPTVVKSGEFLQDDVITTTGDNDSEADGENEAGRDCE